MKAFITGIDGFVGRHMARLLKEERGWSVVGVDYERGTRLEDMVRYETTRYDLVVHAAAAGPNRAAIDSQLANFPYNVGLDATMFEWAIRTKQPRFVYFSSCAVYSPTLMGTNDPFREHILGGEPFDVYGSTKRIGERMAQQARKAGVGVLTVRPFSGYGEDQSLDFPFQAFVQRARSKEDPFTIWGNADQVRDWIHIDDICQAVYTLVGYGPFTEPINLCTGVGTSMLELKDLICKAAGYAPQTMVDQKAPMGMYWRVGDPGLLHNFYMPKISIEEGVARAFKL